jgi:hypothetical protein
MPTIDYAMVRQIVPMARVLELLAFEPVARNGQQLRGPCPVHRSSSPESRSFSVNLATQAFDASRATPRGTSSIFGD